MCASAGIRLVEGSLDLETCEVAATIGVELLALVQEASIVAAMRVFLTYAGLVVEPSAGPLPFDRP